MSRVLVVEDEQAIREFLAVVLRDAGHEVRVAINGLDALRQLEAEKPDLVLLDVMMPVLDGREVLKRMRADPRLSQVSIVVMSAAAEPGHLDGGFDGFMAKPFELEGLIGLVDELLRNRES